MENNFNFEQFVKIGSKLGTYYISITKNGAFGVSSGFYNAENIKSFTHALLYYDKTKNVIGIQFINDDAKKGAFKISHGNNTATIVARSFFTSILHADIKELSKYARRYTPETYNNGTLGKLFYIELQEKAEDI